MKWLKKTFLLYEYDYNEYDKWPPGLLKEFTIKKIIVWRGKYYYADDGCKGCLGNTMKWGHKD